jgi:hypothetical protein
LVIDRLSERQIRLRVGKNVMLQSQIRQFNARCGAPPLNKGGNTAGYKNKTKRKEIVFLKKFRLHFF